MANIKYIKVGNNTYTIRDPNAPKTYISSTAPQEGSMGDLWLKTERILEGEAYAVFDSSDRSLTIFRDEAGRYTDRQVVGTKTYYAGIENITGETYPKWIESNIIKVVIEDIFKPKTAYYMFGENANLTDIEGIENLDTSKCTNMRGMFSACYGLVSLDLSNFNTINVTTMEGMFSACANLTSLNLSSFNTSNVTDMYAMFSGCYKITAALNIMNMPTYYDYMCSDASRDSGQLTLKYTAPVTSADIDLLVAEKGSGNVVNGGPA